MLPSECVLERRVLSDGDADLADNNLRLSILKCKDKKVDGYEGRELEIYNKRLEGMEIGVLLADAPLAVSYLVIRGGLLFAEIVAVDKTVIVIRLGFSGDGGRMSYLIYDAVALSLRLIAPPENGNPAWIYTLSSNVSIARQGQDDVYALVHTGMLPGVDKVDSLHLWRPSSWSRPWSEKKKSRFSGRCVNETDTEFSLNGHAYWVDLLCGVSYCSCDALFDDNTSVAKFGFIPLPVKKGARYRDSKRVAQPVAYRTMGVVIDSFVRFVSIDGFQKHVKLEDRTVTVWRLLDHDQDDPWKEEHKFSLKGLWGFEGFGDELKDLTPMYPLLSAKDKDVLYLVLGEAIENLDKRKFIPSNMRHLLAVDMRKKIVTSVPLAHSFPNPFISCGFSRRIRKALAGPCNNEEIPIPMMKEPRRDGGNVAEAPAPKKPRTEKPVHN